MGKLAGVAVIVIAAGAGAGLHYLHSPKTMMTAVVKGMNDGIIEDYFTGEAKKNLEAAQKGGNLLSIFSASAEEKLVQVIMEKMSEVDWELNSVEYQKASGTAYVDFKYTDKYLDIDGTIVFNIEKIQPEGSFFENLTSNPWRISGIEKIDF